MKYAVTAFVISLCAWSAIAILAVWLVGCASPSWTDQDLQRLEQELNK